MAGKIYIGTSGWTYSHWKGVFYPADFFERKWLEYYAKHFDTVELNASFYRLPRAQTFINWRERTPENFLFAVKASRFITHVKRLNDCKEPWEVFISRVKKLKEKLGPILFQLSPSMKVDIKRLESFLKILPKDYRYAVEPRHESWFDEEIYKILKKYNVALCIADSPEFPTAEVVTADFIYIRFHGGKILYGSRYNKKEMQEWAQKIKKWTKAGLDVHAYFNNDASGYAVENAEELKKLLNS